MADPTPTAGPGPIVSTIVKGIVGSIGRGSTSLTDVLKKSPAWNDADALLLKRDEYLTASSGRVSNLRDAIWQNNARGAVKSIDQRLAELASDDVQVVEPPDDFEEPLPNIGDGVPLPTFPETPDLSPVLPGLNPWILAAGSGNFEKIGGKWIRKKAKKKSARVKVKLPRTTSEKTVDAALKLLKKVPKWALPDKDLIKLAKGVGKSGWGLIATTVGEVALRQIIEIAEKRQFAQMEKALGPDNAALRSVNKQIATRTKGPTTRRGAGKLEPARPPPPLPPSTTGVAAIPARTPKPKAASTPPLAATPQPKAAVAPRITVIPGKNPSYRLGPPPKTVIGKALDILREYQKFDAQYGTLFRLALAKLHPDSSRSLSPFVGIERPPVTQTETRPLASYFGGGGGATTTGTQSGCYTVCRKKSTGKKKRKSPRICVTKTAARRAGII